jgi:hypothetical protein
MNTNVLETKFANETEVFNSINWDKVGDEIKKTFDLNTTLTFKQDRKSVKMISDNLISQCGIFNRAISECYLTFFSNSLSTETDKNKFWATIDLSYPGNGMSIGTVWVMNDDTIIVKTNSPR